jgi:hypothetical protein
MIDMTRPLLLKLLWPQIISTVLPVVLIVAVLVVSVIPMMNNELEQHQMIVAESVANQLETVLKGAEEHLKLIALDIINNPNAATLSNRLDGFVQTADMFVNLYVTNKSNRIIHIGLPRSQTAQRQTFLYLDISFSELWQNEKQLGLSSWSNIYTSPISGNQTIALKLSMGSLTLVAEFDVQRLPRILANMPFGEQRVFLLDEQGRIIAASHESLDEQQVELGLGTLASEDREEIHSAVFLLQGEEYYATTLPIHSLQWQSVVAEPADSLYKLPRSVQMMSLVIAVVSLVLSLLLTYRSALRLNQPPGSGTDSDRSSN